MKTFEEGEWYGKSKSGSFDKAARDKSPRGKTGFPDSKKSRGSRGAFKGARSTQTRKSEVE
jgi:hypothetical protein